MFFKFRFPLFYCFKHVSLLVFSFCFVLFLFSGLGLGCVCVHMLMHKNPNSILFAFVSLFYLQNMLMFCLFFMPINLCLPCFLIVCHHMLD